MSDSASSILVTGGTGFAGSHLVELLLKTHPQTEIHVTSYSSKPSIVDQWLDATNIHQIDLRDQAATTELLQKIQPTQIYHLAAIAQVGGSYGKAAEVFSNNFGLQFSLLEAVRQVTPTAKVLVIGSAQEYDVFASADDTSSSVLTENAPLGPSNPYGVSKVAQDLLALSYFYSYKLNILRARPFNHLGERQELGFAAADFAHQIAQAEQTGSGQINVGNLEAIRDFSDVKDVVKAYQLIMEQGTLGEVYNIGSGKGTSIQFILDYLISISQAKIDVIVDQSKLRPLDVKSIVADAQKLESLGWKTQLPLEKTLQRVLDYWRSQV